MVVQRLADEVADHAAAHRPVRQRIERGVGEDRAGDRADPTERDLVAGKRLAGQRVADDRADARQIAAPPGFGRDRERLEPGRVVPRALIVRRRRTACS